MTNKKTIDFSNIKVSCEDCSLNELCLPRGLDTQDLGRLEEIVKRSRPLRTGEYIFRAGDKLTNLFAVRSGTVKLVLIDENGDDQIIGFYFPGEIIGLDAIDSERHLVSAIAIETSTYCGFPFNKVNEICRLIPELQNQLFKLMSRQLTAENELLLTIGKKNAEEKLSTFLLSISSRFQAMGYSSREFNLSMSRQETANYLGLTIETVSRIMSRFQREGLISINRKQVRIINMDTLRNLSTGCLSTEKKTG